MDQSIVLKAFPRSFMAIHGSVMLGELLPHCPMKSVIIGDDLACKHGVVPVK